MDSAQIIDHIEARMDKLEEEWNELQEAARLLHDPKSIREYSLDNNSKLARINELSRLKDDIINS